MPTGRRRNMEAAALSSTATADLSERDAQILDFERQWWRYAGAKDDAISELFDLNATRYYQILNSLLDNPAALARSEEHTSELQSRGHLVCRLLLETKK